MKFYSFHGKSLVLFIFSTRWNPTPFSLGSYSYPSVNCDSSNITPNDLARPVTSSDLLFRDTLMEANKVTTPLILFAGEGVHQYFWSTAHGAYVSGEDQANVILHNLKEINE